MHTDGSPVDYTSWGGGQPGNNGIDEDCAGFYSDKTIHDFPCHYSMKFVCQNWVLQATGPKYIVHHDELEFAAAQAVCESEARNLVSLHSQAERDEVNALLAGELFWVGLNDQKNEGTWEWTDGSP